VAVYVDLPFHVSQPHGEPLDLSLSDQEILGQTEKTIRADPSFKTMDRWVEDFRQSIN
jgi:catechol 2,3-dioxygenase